MKTDASMPGDEQNSELLGQLVNLLAQALSFRRPYLAEQADPDGLKHSALRLFNGFWEGFPGLAVDLFGHTLVFHGYESSTEQNRLAALIALDYYSQALPEPPACALLKNRTSEDPAERDGLILAGTQPDARVHELGIWYALDLHLHQDASLYLDTRLLRQWAKENLNGARVLNTFAYTGSLGAAALGGGARQVIQTDLSAEFLAVARQTYHLNGWAVQPKDFIVGDFFSVVKRFKTQDDLFDCVFLDPPFFSVTGKGRVDLNNQYARLLNKVRPLVGDGGRLVAVNNGVFVSGRQFMDTLEEAASGGYLEIESLVPAPPDFTGFAGRPLQPLPADPAPFNYSTKIAILRVRRKDGRRA